MATVTRVPQDMKVEGKTEKRIDELFSVRILNGVEVGRRLVNTNTSVVDTRQFVPQPDRILLNLSIEEARAVKDELGTAPWLPLRAEVYRALSQALSSSPGTPASSAVGKDGGCALGQGVAGQMYR